MKQQRIKRTYSLPELAKINGHVMNYTVNVSYFGAKATLRVHIGLKGNHLEIIQELVAKEFGKQAKVLGAKITGKPWTDGPLAAPFMLI